MRKTLLTQTQWQQALGDVKDLAQADAYLSNQIDIIGGGQKPAGFAIRDFFVSPDVAEYFRFTYRMNRATFLELVNSFIRVPLHETLLDAFLMSCQDDGDLFTVNVGGSVSYNKEGWELVDEMPVAGPVRNLRPVKLVGLDDLEKWLVKNKAQFIQHGRRSVLAPTLGDRVRTTFPNLTPDKFMDAMHFFSRVGRMYNM